MEMGTTRQSIQKPGRFKRLGEVVEAASWELKTDWKPRIALLKAEYEEALLAEAETLRARLDKAALQWISDGTFPAMTPRETFFLQARFVGAWQLLYQLETDAGTTVFRTAVRSDKELLAWLLTIWGRDTGTMEGLDRIATSWEAQERIGDKGEHPAGG